MEQEDLKQVLVTGGTGFLGTHCVLLLLTEGFAVRAAVRDRSRGEELKRSLSKRVDVSGLEIVQADLGRDDGWDDAARGCQYVLHIASPVPRSPVKNATDLINSAREGTLRVLKAATGAGVKRVVMTSSTAAVIWGQNRDGSKVYDERDWTVLNEQVGPYEQSKTLAEKAAWDFIQQAAGESPIELVTILPGLILGPLLSKEFSISGEIVKKLMTRELPGIPDLGFAPVDVRDVAKAHVDAMLNPRASGQRFIVALEHIAWRDMALLLAEHCGPLGFKIPTRKLPSWLLKVVAVFDKTTALAVPELGKRQDVSCEKARQELSFQPRDVKTMLFDMADSMIEEGVVPRPKKGKTSSFDSAHATT